MRIAVATENKKGLESAISHHFGRCPFFALVDVEDQQIQSITEIDNPYFQGHAPGQVPTFIHQQQADVMLSGGMGRRAVEFFQQYNIQPATGASGTVRQAVEDFLAGKLRTADPCAQSQAHHHHH